MSKELVTADGTADKCDFVLNDVLNWKTSNTYDITIAIGFWDYIQEPPERLRLIRKMTRKTFLSAWPRFWTWRMPVRKVRLQYIQGCPVYFFRRAQVEEMLRASGFEVVRCDTVGKLERDIADRVLGYHVADFNEVRRRPRRGMRLRPRAPIASSPRCARRWNRSSIRLGRPRAPVTTVKFERPPSHRQRRRRVIQS